MAIITVPAAETALRRLFPRQDCDGTSTMPDEQKDGNCEKLTLQYLWLKGYFWKEVDYPKKGKCETSGVKDSQLGKSCNPGRRGQFLCSILLIFLLMLLLPSKAAAAPVWVPACERIDDDAILAAGGVVQEGGKSQANPQPISDKSLQETVPVTPLSGSPVSPVSASYVFALIVFSLVLLKCILPCFCEQQCLP